MTGFVQLQLRRGTASLWTSTNPVLAAGEMAYETDTAKFKLGDGATAWNSLAYGGLQGPAGANGSNGAGVATGGSAHQALTKIDATNFNTQWEAIVLAAQTLGVADGITFTGTLGGTPSLALANNGISGAKLNGNSVPTSKLAGAGSNFLVGDNSGGAVTGNLTPTQVTAMMNVATQTLQGMLSALDKKLIDDLHYDFVADFGGVGNDSTLNDTQFANAISTMPAGSVLFIPAGTYRVSAAIDINVDKRLTFKGVNRYASIIKTTSATAHTFTKSVAGWYDMWTDLGFQSSVTKTAGAAINIPVGNNIGMNVYRCWFTGMFQAINASGNQSANLAVWADLDISAVANGGRGIFINGATINVMIHNVTINAGAATTSACCEIQSSGAVQVTNCDWIQGTNVVLFNAASALGAQACYFTNCFFDQPQGSVVKVMGGFTAGRLNFSQCGIAPTGNNHAVEVNGTGAGGVGTTTALPAGIKLSSCDIYSANGTNTGAGVRVNGCQDVTIQNCNITGFNGTGGAAVWVTPSAGNQTKVRVNGNILGPNSNLTITNATGVLLDAGSSALGFLSITDNSMIGCATAITDNSTILTTASKNINNNQGAVAGLSTSLGIAAGVTLSTTEVLLAQIYLPPNSCKVGTTFKYMIAGTATATTLTVSARIGTGGVNTDAALVGLVTVAMAAAGMVVQGASVVGVVGATAAHNGALGLLNGTTTNNTATPTQSGTFNSTVGNYISLFAKGGAAGPLVRAATIEIISPA